MNLSQWFVQVKFVPLNRTCWKLFKSVFTKLSRFLSVEAICPVSVTRNKRTVFIRNLPDVTAEDFSKVDLHHFKWIHWEVSKKPSSSSVLNHIFIITLILFSSTIPHVSVSLLNHRHFLSAAPYQHPCWALPAVMVHLYLRKIKLNSVSLWSLSQAGRYWQVPGLIVFGVNLTKLTFRSSDVLLPVELLYNSDLC